MITRDVIPIGAWIDDPNGAAGKWRIWGQRVCIAYPEEPGVMAFAEMPGTAFKEWSDGHHEPINSPSG
jgi:hypothetical protein